MELPLGNDIGKKCRSSDECGEKSFCHHWEGEDSKSAYCMHCNAIVIVDFKCSDWKMLSAQGKKECEQKCANVGKPTSGGGDSDSKPSKGATSIKSAVKKIAHVASMK